MKPCILLFFATITYIFCEACANNSSGSKRLMIAFVRESDKGKRPNDTVTKSNGQHQKTGKPGNRLGIGDTQSTSDACDCRNIKTTPSNESQPPLLKSASKQASEPFSDYSVEQNTIGGPLLTPTEQISYSAPFNNSGLFNEHNTANENSINENNQSQPTTELRQDYNATREIYFKISKKALINVLSKCNFLKKDVPRLHRTRPTYIYTRLGDLFSTIGNRVNMGLHALTNIGGKIKDGLQGISVQDAGEMGSGGGGINIVEDGSSYLDDENSYFNQDSAENGKLFFVEHGNASGQPFNKGQSDRAIQDNSGNRYIAVQGGSRSGYKVEGGTQASNKNNLNLLPHSITNELLSKVQVNAGRNLNMVGHDNAKGGLKPVQKGSASTNFVIGHGGLDVKMPNDADASFSFITDAGANFGGKGSNLDLTAQDYITFTGGQVNQGIEDEGNKEYQDTREINSKFNLAVHGNVNGNFFTGKHHSGEAGHAVGVQSNGGGGKAKGAQSNKGVGFNEVQGEAGGGSYYLPHDIVQGILNTDVEGHGNSYFDLAGQSKLGNVRFANNPNGGGGFNSGVSDSKAGNLNVIKHDNVRNSKKNENGVSSNIGSASQYYATDGFSSARLGNDFNAGMHGKEVKGTYTGSHGGNGGYNIYANIDDQMIANALFNILALGVAAGGIFSKEKGHNVDFQGGAQGLHYVANGNPEDDFNFKGGNSASDFFYKVAQDIFGDFTGDQATGDFVERDFNGKVPSSGEQNNFGSPEGGEDVINFGKRNRGSYNFNQASQGYIDKRLYTGAHANGGAGHSYATYDGTGGGYHFGGKNIISTNFDPTVQGIGGGKVFAGGQLNGEGGFELTSNDGGDGNLYIGKEIVNTDLNVAAHSKAENINVAEGQQNGGLGHEFFNVGVQGGGVGNFGIGGQSSVQSIYNFLTKNISNGGQTNGGERFNIGEHRIGEEQFKIKVQGNGRNIGGYSKIGSHLNGGENGKFRGSASISAVPFIKAKSGFGSKDHISTRPNVGIGAGRGIKSGFGINAKGFPRWDFDVNKVIGIDTENRLKAQRLGKIREALNVGRLSKIGEKLNTFGFRKK